MNMVLIGGTGGVGTELMKVIDRTKYNVSVLGSKDVDITVNAHHNLIDKAEVVVNLVGVYDAHPHEIIEINCYGAYKVITSCLPSMRANKWGRIIMMSSVFSAITMPDTAVYSASKAFVDKLVSVTALENAEYGITINSIQLGYMGVGMGERVTKEVYTKSRNKSAMKRFCTPVELYNTIDYIVNTPYLTGQHIRIDGGIR